MKKALKKIIPKRLLKPLLPAYHWLEAVLANLKYGFPAKGLYVIGVTGTNGKTTTANMIGSILQAAGHKVGILSSAVVQVGDDWRDSDLTLTTENAFILQKYLKRMRDAGVTHVALEVSSHAIAQYRAWGVPIKGAVFTNLTQDHLDYHGSMDNYAAVKRKLIKKAKEFVVLNGDDAWFEFFNARPRAMTTVYGTAKSADVRVVSAQISPSGAKASLQTPEGKLDIKLNLTGKYNVYNAMAAVATAQRLKIPAAKIRAGLSRLKSVPGRMEAIDEGQNFSVLVDHAHTPDSLDNLLGNLRHITKKELIVVAGADGERDPTKRVPIGKVLSRWADRVYITDQEPYGDDPAPIRREVIRGLQISGFSDYEEIADRSLAIESALRRARKGDTVVITGLGNQKYRGMAEGKVEWDDRQAVRVALAKIKGSKKKSKKP